MSLEELLKKHRDTIQSGERIKPKLFYPFSILSLNMALGSLRGLQGGRIIQLLADPKCGKTTLAFDLIAQAQREDRLCAFVDFERTFDPTYAKRVGVDTEKLLVIRTRYAEDSLNLVEEVMANGVRLVVIDSVPAAVTSSEQEKDLTESEKMAASAGLWTRFLKRAVPVVSDVDGLLITINQYRSHISKLAHTDKKPYGPAALQYTSGLTINATRIKNEENKATVRLTVAKNKQGKEGVATEVILEHGKGFRADLDILSMAINRGIVNQKGAWLSYKEHKAQGIEKAALEFPLEEIKQEIINGLE